MIDDLATMETEVRLIRAMIKKFEALSASGRDRAMQYLEERRVELNALSERLAAGE